MGLLEDQISATEPTEIIEVFKGFQLRMLLCSAQDNSFGRKGTPSPTGVIPVEQQLEAAATSPVHRRRRFFSSAAASSAGL